MKTILLLSLALILICPPLPVLAWDHSWWVVCTRRVAFSATNRGRIVYCTRCEGPVRVAGSVMIPRNCKRFIMFRKAAEYARNTCNCD